MKTINIEYWRDRPNNFTGIAINVRGTKWWLLNGKLHREDGPAVEWTDGNKHWYLNDIWYTEEQYKKEMAKQNSSLGRLIMKDGYFKYERNRLSRSSRRRKIWL